MCICRRQIHRVDLVTYISSALVSGYWTLFLSLSPGSKLLSKMMSAELSMQIALCSSRGCYFKPIQYVISLKDNRNVHKLCIGRDGT